MPGGSNAPDAPSLDDRRVEQSLHYGMSHVVHALPAGQSAGGLQSSPWPSARRPDGRGDGPARDLL